MTEADELRGHPFLPVEEEVAGVPGLHEPDSTPLGEKTIHLHFFVDGCDWYVAEMDRERRLVYEIVDLGDPNGAERGYLDLAEFRSVVVRPRGYPVAVERDLRCALAPFSGHGKADP